MTWSESPRAAQAIIKILLYLFVELHHPVGFAGFAIVGREGLLPAGVGGADFCPLHRNQHGFAFELAIGNEGAFVTPEGAREWSHGKFGGGI